ncbi:MAG: hypothetical protein CL763_00310 [Chloroflexi bacterium]|nr:hypothetical protein [Chloroflexota bacterium]|tara:strand:+ start:7855 stop:8535 length:681 start_codon:yes stop_codon:yes gene_type:complete
MTVFYGKFWALLPLFTLLIAACGTTEVSVDVEEVNVNAELNSSTETTQSPITSRVLENHQTPIAIPTPVSLEAMTEAIIGIEEVTKELGNSIQGIGEIVASYPTPNPTPTVSQKNNFERKGGIGHVILAGFVLEQETTPQREYDGLENSYKGFVYHEGAHQGLEVFIFSQSISDPSLSSSIALDNMARDGSTTDFFHNLAFSCKLETTCRKFLSSLEEQAQYFESS